MAAKGHRGGYVWTTQGVGALMGQAKESQTQETKLFKCLRRSYILPSSQGVCAQYCFFFLQRRADMDHFKEGGKCGMICSYFLLSRT